MADSSKDFVKTLKDFVYAQLLVLRVKRTMASSTHAAKSYGEKGDRLIEQFKEKKRQLRLEQSRGMSKESRSKRKEQIALFQAETVKLQQRLSDLMKKRRQPALHNANAKWKTREDSLDPATAAQIAEAAKRGVAFSHRTQFAQDRRLSDTFDFGSSAAHCSFSENRHSESFSDFGRSAPAAFNLTHTVAAKETSQPLAETEMPPPPTDVSVAEPIPLPLNETYTKRTMHVSHIHVDDCRRLIGHDIYATELDWLDLQKTDEEACRAILALAGVDFSDDAAFDNNNSSAMVIETDEEEDVGAVP